MILETIKKEITKSTKSRYLIAKESGISEAQLCRIMQGKRACSIETANILLKYFGYKLTKGKVQK